MQLDLSTLVLATIALCYGLGALSIVFSLLQAGTRGARYWGMGMIGIGAGYTLILLNSLLPGYGLLIPGWVLLVLSVLLLYQALIRIYGGNHSGAGFGLTVFACAALGWGYFAFVVPSLIAGINTTSLAISAITGRAAWDMWRQARHNAYKAPAVVVAVLLLIVTVTPLLEIVMLGFGSHGIDLELPFGRPVAIFARVLILAALSVCVLWLEISRLYDIIEAQATHDELTGVSNRRAVLAQLQRELAQAQRTRQPYSIALFDVDFFKRVNDTWGHPVGDEVLKWVTKMIGRNIRVYDTLGRYGGEEFLVLMPGTNAAAAFAVSDRARVSIENEACTVDAKQISLTISVGVAAAAADGDADTLLVRADEALYSAKKSGRNRVVIAESVAPDSQPAAALA